MIQLTAEQKLIVSTILRECVPTSQVWVFGSRSKGTKKQFADLDLLISSTVPLSPEVGAKLRDAFSESNLPFRVDIVDAESASEEFLAAIKDDEVQIQ